jgi:hypothetical protein
MTRAIAVTLVITALTVAEAAAQRPSPAASALMAAGYGVGGVVLGLAVAHQLDADGRVGAAVGGAFGGVLGLRLSLPTRVSPPRSVIATLPDWQVRQEQTNRYATTYALGGILLGAATGMLAGGRVGYAIDYPRDIRRGCEDCGLGGALLGMAVGGLAGGIAGGTVGARYGARLDRDEAAARILERRAERP